MTPLFGVQDSYGTNTAGYNNTLDFFVLMWAILSLFFLFGSLLINIVYIGIFFVELAFALIAASYFATANGKPDGATALKKAGGVFESLAGLLGYYDAAAHLMYQT